MLKTEHTLWMSRGSTFKFKITVPSEYDLRNAQVMYVTFVQNGETIVEKTKEKLTITSNTVTVVLTQEETLMFNTGSAKLQMRAKLYTGEAIVQQPPTDFTVMGILKDGKI